MGLMRTRQELMKDMRKCQTIADLQVLIRHEITGMLVDYQPALMEDRARDLLLKNMAYLCTHSFSAEEGARIGSLLGLNEPPKETLPRAIPIEEAMSSPMIQ